VLPTSWFLTPSRLVFLDFFLLRLRDSCFPPFGFLWLFFIGGPCSPYTAFGTRVSQFELLWLFLYWGPCSPTPPLGLVIPSLNYSGFFFFFSWGWCSPILWFLDCFCIGTCVFSTFLPLRLRGSCSPFLGCSLLYMPLELVFSGCYCFSRLLSLFFFFYLSFGARVPHSFLTRPVSPFGFFLSRYPRSNFPLRRLQRLGSSNRHTTIRLAFNTFVQFGSACVFSYLPHAGVFQLLEVLGFSCFRVLRWSVVLVGLLTTRLSNIDLNASYTKRSLHPLGYSLFFRTTS
jgi:hypothetical protein